MPKCQFIDPAAARAKGEVEIPPIPVNSYDRSLNEELEAGNFTREDLIRIYRDMVIIREFETMLQLVKTTGAYKGIEYNNPGPAHLSAGQEAAAVGMAYTLGVDDYIFGSHRSHGEILAKGLRSIELLPEARLGSIMDSFWNGATLAAVKRGFDGPVKELGMRFLLYGALAEIFARETGFNKGLGGSMHTFFIPFGIYPNNAIVGGKRKHCRGRCALQKGKPQKRDRSGKFRGRLHGLRPRMGGALFRGDGSVQGAVGRGYERRPALYPQCDEQPVRNGRADLRGDHGIRHPGTHRCGG